MAQVGYPSSDRSVTDLPSPPSGPAPGARQGVHGTDHRTCESCGGALPGRMHRQRDEEGRLVCDSCKANPQAGWTTTHSSLSVLDSSEMSRREAEAIRSIVRVRQAKHAGISVVAHDSGDQGIIHHCPMCGSGAVYGRSDGTATCDFCHTSFTVQVQPSHPFMPQTVDGQDSVPPGMPGSTPDPSEMSAPVDPAVAEDEEGVAEDALGDGDPNPPSHPAGPGHPPAGKEDKPNPFEKQDEEDGDKPPFGKKDEDDEKDPKAKKKNLPPWMKNKKSYRTAEGRTLEGEDYMARLALEFADDRDDVLDSVRVAHTQTQAGTSDGLVKHQIKASELKVGDRLDSSGKNRVSKVHTPPSQPDVVLAQTMRIGARSPSILRLHRDDNVTVWRRG